MKIFISWSGEKSKKYAELLKEWLEQCIQSIDVFFSAEDIEKGANWNSKLSTELVETNFGIVCLTSDNITAPWIHFEAGALSKMLTSKVTALVTDISISEIKGPLASFQATKLEKEELYKLLVSINNELEHPLDSSKLRKSFDAFYTDFEKQVQEIKSEKNNLKKDNSKRDLYILVEELLQLTRDVSSTINNPEKMFPIGYLSFLQEEFDLSYKKNKNVNNYSLLYDFADHFVQVVECDSGNSKLLDLYEHLKDIIWRSCRNSHTWTQRFEYLFSKF